MIKELKANGKSSYKDFGIYIKERNVSMPTKRSNRQSVPGMHGSYDFSNIFGEVIYDDRVIEYKFDITGWDIETLDEERRKVYDWIININGTDIVDEYITGYHWFGSFDNGSWQENAEQGLLTVKFVVYPFSIADIKTIVNVTSTSTKQTVSLLNNSSHKISPTIETDGSILIETELGNISVSPGKWELNNFYLNKGNNNIVVSGTANVIFSFYEEVF